MDSPKLTLLMSNDGPAGVGWFRMFVASMRTCSDLLSVKVNVLLRFASKRICPQILDRVLPQRSLSSGKRILEADLNCLT